MTIREGKQFIQDCLINCGIEEPVDSLFVYKYGSRTSIEAYQHDQISTNLSKNETERDVDYVIKCFLCFNVYVVWRLEDGIGNGKLIINKTHLIDLINTSEQAPHQIREVSLGTLGNAWLFGRDEIACRRFIDQYILRNTRQEEAPTHV